MKPVPLHQGIAQANNHICGRDGDHSLRYKPEMRRILPSDEEAREILSRRRTRPMPRPAPKAGRALQGLIKQLDEQFGRGPGALEARWREIVGDRLARVCRPQKLTKGRGGAAGTLELRVVGAAALLVQHQTEDILQRVNLFLGAGTVDRLRIAQGPVKPLADTPVQPKRRAIPTALPAHQEAELNAAVAAAPDDLKASIRHLGRAVLSDRDPTTR